MSAHAQNTLTIQFLLLNMKAHQIKIQIKKKEAIFTECTNKGNIQYTSIWVPGKAS